VLASQLNLLFGSTYYAQANTSTARLTISRLDGSAFTATVSGDDALLTALSASVRVEVVTIPALTGPPSPTLSVLDGLTVLGTATGTTAAGFAATLTGALSAVSGAGTTLIVTRTTSPNAFTFALTTTVVGAVSARNGVTFTFTGDPAQGETWNVAAGAASGTHPVSVGQDIDAVIASLTSQLSSTSYLALRQGRTITLSSALPLSPRTVSVTPSAASTVSAALVTRAVTVAGTGNAGDTWTLQIDGAPRQYVVPALATQTPTQVAAGLDGLSLPGAYASFADGATLYVTGTTGFALDLLIARSTNAAAQPTISGTPRIAWTQDVLVQPAGPTATEPQLGDVWTLVVGSTTYRLVVAGTGATFTLQVNGTLYTIPPGATPADTIALGFSSALAAVAGLTVSVSGGHLLIAAADGSTVAVGPLVQVRRAATLETPTTDGATQTDSRVHYSTAIFTLESDSQSAWTGGETWTVEINGRTFSFTVPSTGPAGTLTTIAAGLALAIDADPSLSATSSGATITVSDTTANNPFYFKVSRGSGHLTGVFDVDFANSVSGTTQVPVVLPWYQWLVDLIPWLRPYLQTIDLLSFTARPAFQLLDGAGNVLKTVTCTIQPGTTEVQGQTVRPTVCSSVADPGSLQSSNPLTSDPFLSYTFTRADTYSIKVGAWIDYADKTQYLQVDNTVLPSGFYGVQSGMSYRMFVSLQRHATNPDAITLAGKTITIVEGPGAGQTATIVSYDSTTSTYTLDRKWSTAPGPGSKFQIEQSTDTLSGYTPTTDAYQVVLTSSPSSQVIVNVSPQPTPTYNSSAAFDPAANYGQNNLVQARVQTSRATFLLTGRPADGETWTILLNDRAFSFAVSASTSLATIAETLAVAIRSAGYTVVVTDAMLLVTTTAPVGGTAPAFYAGFRIDHDVAGGALVTPITASATKITLTRRPGSGRGLDAERRRRGTLRRQSSRLPTRSRRSPTRSRRGSGLPLGGRTPSPSPARL